MSAQSARLNTTASNLANANTVASSAETAYRSRQPVFQTVMDNSAGMDPASAGVRVAGVVETTGPRSTTRATRSPTRTASSTCPTSIRWTSS
jgi:flagellar basal-body rod protein FlgC